MDKPHNNNFSKKEINPRNSLKDQVKEIKRINLEKRQEITKLIVQYYNQDKTLNNSIQEYEFKASNWKNKSEVVKKTKDLYKVHREIAEELLKNDTYVQSKNPNKDPLRTKMLI